MTEPTAKTVAARGNLAAEARERRTRLSEFVRQTGQADDSLWATSEDGKESPMYEHFGFRDGVSQPGIRGLTRRQNPDDDEQGCPRLDAGP